MRFIATQLFLTGLNVQFWFRLRDIWLRRTSEIVLFYRDLKWIHTSYISSQFIGIRANSSSRSKEVCPISFFFIVVFSSLEPSAEHISFKILHLNYRNKSTDVFITYLINELQHERSHLRNYYWRVFNFLWWSSWLIPYEPKTYFFLGTFEVGLA